ncbi:MAG: PduL/EutD family phosphate acyltransferase [Patescibacteria group bacterium]|nr:PduL/EutD family phosphate acyltransferase [Patescibacteria group bacterium]
MRVRLEVSGHHCHVTASDLEKLFGAGHRLRVLRPVSQPGQFAAVDVVRIKIGRGEFTARIVGPVRKRTQVEISLTEAKKFHVKPPLSYFEHTAAADVSCELIGPNGRVRRKAVIITQRHIHSDPKTAARLHLHNHQEVSVKTRGPRSLTFHRVIVRVHPDYRFRCQLDTDEANAAGIEGGEWGTIVVKNEKRKAQKKLI